MRLLESFKKAEEEGRRQAHQKLQQAEEFWAEAERRIRRKMRIHPRRTSMEAKRAESERKHGTAA